MGEREIYCVIGAGAAGLATAAVFARAGIAFEVLEAADDIGGIWDAGRPDSPVTRNTHTIASRGLQSYVDFPMPADWPTYPGHAKVLSYLRSYADRNDLRPHIRLNSAVKSVEPLTGAGPAQRWCVTLDDGTRLPYAGVVLATGHDRRPRMLTLPGVSTVDIMHSNRYRGPEQVAGRRVLVIGAGQSAADILADCATVAERTLHSTRRGFFCMPKYLFGRPTDTMLQARAPKAMRRMSYRMFFRFLRRRSRAVGIPVPSFAEGLVIPVLGEQLHHHYSHGDIEHRGHVTAVDGDVVTFADGGREPVDLIILATGFLPAYPMVEPALLNWSPPALKPALYLHIFPPDTANLFVVGMVRPIGSHWDVYERQAELVAAYLRADTPERTARFDRLRRGPQPDLQAGLRFYNAGEYPLVVEKQEYLNQLRRHRRMLGDR